VHGIALVVGGAIWLSFALKAFAWDMELRDLDLSGWNCLNKPSGSARHAGEAERNLSKNRSAMANAKSTPCDLTLFLEWVSEFDRQLGNPHSRSQLNTEQKAKLLELEKQVVTLTGWLVLAYSGPAESTNCSDSDYHDWHLELLETPLDHAPGAGDSTAIICEITPRTERDLYRRGIRLRDLASYIRSEDNTPQPTGHLPHKVRATGLIMWDDAHSGGGEVGSTIARFDPHGLPRPWRRTAWELHPIWEIFDAGMR
jgi:hypothetical protein